MKGSTTEKYCPRRLLLHQLQNLSVAHLGILDILKISASVKLFDVGTQNRINNIQRFELVNRNRRQVLDNDFNL